TRTWGTAWGPCCSRSADRADRSATCRRSDRSHTLRALTGRPTIRSPFARGEPVAAKNKVKRPVPRIPKGFRDQGPEDLTLRRRMIETVCQVYERYGFTALETPAIEY